MNCRKHVKKPSDVPKVCPAAKRLRRELAAAMYLDEEMSACQIAKYVGFVSGLSVIQAAGRSLGRGHGQECRRRNG